MEMETFRVQFRARKRKITPRIAVVLADDSWRLAHWSQQRHCDIIMQLCRPLITLDISLTARITLIRPPLLFRCHCRTTMPAQTDTPPLTIATRQTTEAKKRMMAGEVSRDHLSSLLGHFFIIITSSIRACLSLLTSNRLVSSSTERFLILSV